MGVICRIKNRVGVEIPSASLVLLLNPHYVNTKGTYNVDDALLSNQLHNDSII